MDEGWRSTMRGAFCLLALLAVVAPAPGTGFSFKVLTLNALHDKPTGDATRGEWAPHFCLRNRARLFMTEAPLPRHSRRRCGPARG